MVNQTEDLLEKDEKYVWHGMRKHNPKGTMVVTEADGAWIQDGDGNRYLDGMAGLWSVNVGYGRKELAKASYDQLKKMAFYPLTQSHQPAIELSAKLNEWLDDEYVIFYSNSGSEANETAFKIARQYHRQNGSHDRYKFISRYRAYHGNTMGTLAATGQAQRKYKYEPLATGFLHVAPPDCYRSLFNSENGTCCTQSANDIERVINWEMEETVAGVIMEANITGGGVLIPHDHYLQQVRDICDRTGTLLIIDEVINGFGRTGKPFGFMHSGIKPDIITMAKGITSAYLPLSATAVRKEIFDSFTGDDEYDFFRHVNTFGGSPAACAVALKNIEIIERENLIEKSKLLGEAFYDDIKVLYDHPNVGDIRQQGLLIGIELVEDKTTKQPLASEQVDKVIGLCKKAGLIIGKNGYTVEGFNNILTLSPPLNITDQDLEFITATLKDAVNQI